MEVVAKLYVASGRSEPPGEIDFETWGEALVDVSDEEGRAAAHDLARYTDWTFLRPNPAMVRFHVRRARERAPVPELPGVEKVTPKPRAAELARELKAQVAKIPVRRPVRPE